jgi:hypothetical protein
VVRRIGPFGRSEKYIPKSKIQKPRQAKKKKKKEQILKRILTPILNSFYDMQGTTHCDFMSPKYLTVKFWT